MVIHGEACASVEIGDACETLRRYPDGVFNTCVTSPPYYGLRDYQHAGQMGLEATPEAYTLALVTLMREVRRTLREDGTLWLNLGDSYAGNGGQSPQSGTLFKGRMRQRENISLSLRGSGNGLKQKDLIGIPWRVAFALQADGWYLRQDIIWHKPNPMPESVTDRCTKAHEYIFMLTKSPRYYYDADAIAEPLASASVTRLSQATLEQQQGSNRVPGKPNGPMKAVARQYYGSDQPYTGSATKDYAAGGAQDASATKQRIVDRILSGEISTRNKRDVWTITTKPFKGAHFATFPPDLIEPCILAGCPRGGLVLDPFGGSGTTAAVSLKHGRNAIVCEINPEFAAMLPARCAKILG